MVGQLVEADHVGERGQAHSEVGGGASRGEGESVEHGLSLVRHEELDGLEQVEGTLAVAAILPRKKRQENHENESKVWALVSHHNVHLSMRSEVEGGDM